MQTVPSQMVGRRKRSHEIVELLEKAITSGEFEVGSQLPSEKVLAERFGVGRPSVREALFLLQQQGLRRRHQRHARARHRRRPTVCSSVSSPASSSASPRPTEGQNQMEQARLLFEAGVAWQAAQVATDEDIVRLKKALDANVAAMGNTAEFIRTDVAFHYELNAITQEPDLRGRARDPGGMADRSAHDDDPHARRRSPFRARSHQHLRGGRGARSDARVPRDGQPPSADQPALSRIETPLARRSCGTSRATSRSAWTARSRTCGRAR